MTSAAAPVSRFIRGSAARKNLRIVGRDIGREPRRAPRNRQAIHAALLGAACALLLLAGLRVQLTELRYRLAEATREEHALDETRRELIVEVRRLRDPKRLAELAARQGFVRPESVIDLRGASTVRRP
ncbi:MAG TPA: hypothetical protein VKE73_03550 [Myxococcota bacterium]|nr:hypothetical protein [Myxococcota bacterium]